MSVYPFDLYVFLHLVYCANFPSLLFGNRWCMFCLYTTRKRNINDLKHQVSFLTNSYHLYNQIFANYCVNVHFISRKTLTCMIKSCHFDLLITYMYDF